MPTVHFLNVGCGDCSIIEHGSSRVSMIDICKGNADEVDLLSEALRNAIIRQNLSGNFGMRDRPTQPIGYLKRIGVKSIFRFILTHPDMDHMDGFEPLCQQIGISNFWDSGVRKEKPDFSGGGYKEEDWDYYEMVRDGKVPGITVVTPRAGSVFAFANKGEPEDRGDGLSIVAPDNALVLTATNEEDANDGSYVIVYRTVGGNIIFPGDAHDGTWEYILKNHATLVKDCAVLIAPHHGRHSDRLYDFLDILQPKLTLFGCADSEHLGYGAWNSRDLKIITNNQAGNVVLDANSNGIDVFVENETFAKTWSAFDQSRRKHESYFIGTIFKPALSVA